MLYSSLREGLNSKGMLIPYDPSQIQSMNDSHKDCYISLYQYTEDHKKRIDEKGTVAGIKDTTTDKLYFDFDSKDNIHLAINDALTTARRLINRGVNQDSIQAFFTGAKGISLEVYLNDRLTPQQFKNIVTNIAGDLKTFDTAVTDPNRIVRIINTKHQKSGLYKIHLELWDLDEMPLEEILEKAKNQGVIPSIIRGDLPKYLLEVEEQKNITVTDSEIDWLKKPKQWKNCKWALLQGHFDAGQRHEALFFLAATCRGLGYDKETTYYLCKSALKKQAHRTKQDEFPKEELWNNIIEQSIFADTWEGGQGTCKSDPWLKSYCEQLGPNKCATHDEDFSCTPMRKMNDQFIDYTTNFDQNVIKTGIKELDDNATLLASTLIGLVGNPGAGKTNIALNYLKNASNTSIPSVFFSLDMGLPLIFSKLVQKITGHSFKQVQHIFQTNPKLRAELSEKVEKEYVNVGFNFKSGLTVSDMKNIVLKHEEQTGKKVKLIIIDYLECIAGPYSDVVANTGFIANQLKDLANELSACVLLLLQTQKHSTPDISDPLLSLKTVKGSSLIEQSCSVILTAWREGYNPDLVDYDKFISIAVVKNRFGPLWKGDFSWEGVTGNIKSLTEIGRKDLEILRKKKIARKLEALKNKDDF